MPWTGGDSGTHDRVLPPRTLSEMPVSRHHRPVLGSHHRPVRADELARTGASASLAVVVPASAGLLLGGTALYRRFRSNA